ncbi:50S ribosomal protein L22 [bacterium]|nr:50S ribosomal protein L22 [bacterium]
MEVKAKLNYLRIAPRKMRLLADLIRGKRVVQARTILDFTLKRGCRPLKKLLESAIANAKNNFQLEEKDLWISEIRVDEGPKLKRWRARARGRAAEIQKKTSHITLVLFGEKKKPKIAKVKKERGEKEEVLREKAKPKPEVQKPEKEIVPTKVPLGRKKIFRRKAI